MTAIAIFVKTPGHSPIKTRLAIDIGRELAEQWHRCAAKAVAEMSLATDIGPVYFAVAEAEALDDPLWSGLPRTDQGVGGLGARMHRVHSSLVERHGAAILLGADTIQWQIDQLRQAHDWLSSPSPRWVIGPATDGGFWTFGANRELPESSWNSVSYSQDDTRRQFLRQLGDAGKGLTLPALTDLDTLADLSALRSELEVGPQAGPALLEAVHCLEMLDRT